MNDRIVRAFTALKLPDTVVERIAGAEDQLKKAGFRASWTKPVNVHLTIRFLGDIEESRVPAISAALKKAAEASGPLSLRTTGVGGFPDLKRPRVIWIGLEESPGLSALYGNVERVLSPVGFAPEERPFRPHLTICRVKSRRSGPGGRGGRGERGGSADDARAAGAAAAGLDIDLAVDFTVDSLILYRGELKPDGAVHTPLGAWRLGG